MNDQKPQLHYSAFAMYQKCGMQYYYRYVKGFKIPPGVSIVVGSAVHMTAEKILRQKMAGVIVGVEEAKMASSSFTKILFSDELTYTLKELENVPQIQADNIDKAVRLAGLYAAKIAPKLDPIAAEQQFVIDAGDYSIAGTIDVIERGSVRDLKTSAKTPTATLVDKTNQLTFYSIAYKLMYGELPRTVHLDYLIDLKKGVKPSPQTGIRTQADCDLLIQDCNNVVTNIQKGNFIPTDPVNWWCSKKKCGYHDICRKSHVINIPFNLTLSKEKNEGHGSINTIKPIVLRSKEDIGKEASTAVLVKPSEASRLVSVSLKWLQEDRRSRHPQIPFIIEGKRKVRYKVSDLDVFLFNKKEDSK